MPPTYSARNGRITSRARSMSSSMHTLTVGAISMSSSVRPARARPSSSGLRISSACSAAYMNGIHPSAISPVSAVFFGPIAAMKIGIRSWIGEIISFSALPGPSGSGSW